MALHVTHTQTNQNGEKIETKFGVGDNIRVSQRIVEGGRTRTSSFEGMVIAIQGSGVSRNFIVRRIGEQGIGIEQIFPLFSPNIEKIEIKRHGLSGIRQAKLYFVRDKSKREIERIYSRTNRKNRLAEQSKTKKSSPKKKTVKAVSKTTAKSSK